MKNERIAPTLCLKVNVPYALHNGERVTLASSPKNEDGKIFIPKEALSLLGITAENEYAELGTLGDINVVYEDMGLIFLDTSHSYPSLDTERDLVYILSLAHSFIFDISVGRLAQDYAPATDSEREGFIKVGEELRDRLLKRNNTHPFVFGTQ